MLNLHRSGMLLWVDELVGWMRSLDRDDKAGVRQQFLTLWNGQGRLNIDRIGRGETVVESPCVGLFGCCTPGGLSDCVLAAIAGGRGDDGLMQRLQVTVWPDSPKEYRHVDQWPDSQARQMLAEVFERLADLEPSKFATLDKFDDGGIPNLRSQFMRILAAAGVAPWPKLFVNLRSTRRTELQESFPDHVVNKWLGHSGKVAEKHYLQVTDEHWGKAIESRTPTGSPPLVPLQEPSRGILKRQNPTNYRVLMVTGGVVMTPTIGPVGLEPTTYGLEIRCSIQLSYEPDSTFHLRIARGADGLVSASHSGFPRRKTNVTPILHPELNPERPSKTSLAKTFLSFATEERVIGQKMVFCMLL